jgi:Zn-finger nucleic acid-binding protein
MECARCRVVARSASYREAPQTERGIELVGEAHASGAHVERCSSCGGAFLEYEDLVAVESWGSRKRGRTSSDEMARRAFDPPSAPIECPRCQVPMSTREWRMATMIFVDVCPECRGVWLDVGELERVERA